MEYVNPNITIIKLNRKSLNASIKRQQLQAWVKEQDNYILAKRNQI